MRYMVGLSSANQPSNGVEVLTKAPNVFCETHWIAHQVLLEQQSAVHQCSSISLLVPSAMAPPAAVH